MDEVVEWGVLLRLPTSECTYEGPYGRDTAAMKVSNASRDLGDGSARLVYRVVRYGLWMTGAPYLGGGWGVQVTWPDGHVEVEEYELRVQVERRVSAHNKYAASDGTAELVSREVQVGDWWLADGSAVRA